MRRVSDEVAEQQRALTEIWQQRAHLSPATFTRVALNLLEKIRRLQTHIVSTGPGAAADEIRLVTVVYIDIKDSTQMAQQMDTSDWKSVLGEAHKRVAALIARWGGHVGQYLGDGLLCFFGAQRSGSDDAVRAVSCALAIQAAISEYAHEVLQRHQIEFAARIGISTGRVVVGMIGGATKQEWLALGPSTNLAARLQALAAPGTVLLDSSTYSRVRNAFHLEAAPAVQIKGFDQAIQYYRAIARQNGSDSNGYNLTDTEINGIPMPMVGRDDLLQNVSQGLQQAQKRQGLQAFTLTGEIGVGKSRLLQEILAHKASQDRVLLCMVAHYEVRSTAHNLLRNLLMSSCAINEDSPPAEAFARIREYIRQSWDSEDGEIVAEILAHLMGFKLSDSPNMTLIKNAPRNRDNLAYTWLLRWLHALARTHGLLIAIDNLQWADATSVELINYIAQNMAEENVLIIAAGRPAYRNQTPGYLRETANHQVFTLERLSAEATAKLINSILSRVDRVPQRLAALIHERAMGNPLFVREFLGMLFENGVFQPDEPSAEGQTRWRFNMLNYDEAHSNLPDGLIGVMQARLDDLSAEARQVIQMASIVGQTFWTSVLREIDDTDLEARLSDLVARNMILQHADSVFEDDTQYSFRHSLYRDVAYEMIPRAKREQYHQQVANWLLERIADKPDFYAMLGDQFEAGGMNHAALFTYLEAVQNRMVRGLYVETLTLIDQGLAMARKVPRDVALPVVSQLWTIRSQTLTSLARYEEASAASQSALMLLEEVPADQLIHTRVQAARMLGMAYSRMGQHAEAFKALQQAFDILPKQDIGGMSSVLRSFGSLCLDQGRLSESLAYQKRAIIYAEKTGEIQQTNATLNELGLISLDSGKLAEALSYFERVLEANHARNSIHYQLVDMRNIGRVYLAMQVHERALTTFDEAMALQEILGYEDVLLSAYRALCLIHIGRKAEGSTTIKAINTHLLRDFYKQNLIEMLQLRSLNKLGEYETCRTQAQAFIERIRPVNPLMAARALRQMGTATHRLGLEGAEVMLQEALAREKHFEGGEIWACYTALAQSSTEPERTKAYYQEAAAQLRLIGEGFTQRPDLKYAFLNSSRIRPIFDAAESSD